MSAISDLQAIDVHAHFGVSRGEGSALKHRFMSADAGAVADEAQRSGTRLSMVSPLRAMMPRFEGDPVGGNEDAAEAVARDDRLRQWVVVDPLRRETFDQAAEMLASPRSVGIKVHPEEHGYPIVEQGKRIFEFAAAREAIVLTHSGDPNSMPEDFLDFANAYPETTLILGHLGCGCDDDPSHQIRAIQTCKNSNVFVDTSSAVNITPHLIEWAVKEIGSDRILFGTDSPLYFVPMQRARIDHATMCDDDKRRILIENAERLFNL
jgi:predicted TIM-barrel fold metal-dependent hydrolase